MVKIKDIIALLEEFAPPHIAEDYDNPSLIVGDFDEPVKGILVTLDYTEDVLEYAIIKNCNLVIMHHPIWFGSRKNLNSKDWIGRLLLKTIKNNINLYAVHTNLDKTIGGVNHKIAEKLGLINTDWLLQEEENIGLGLVGELPKGMDKVEFLSYVKKVFKVPVIRYSDANIEKVKRVAVCGGSCSFLIEEIKKQGNIDAYITADITYHKFFENEGKFLLIDAGHYETEQYTVELLKNFLEKIYNNLLILHFPYSTNPIKYF